MTEIKVSDLMQKLVPEILSGHLDTLSVEKREARRQWEIKYIFNLLDFFGEHNAHLSNPLCTKNTEHYSVERREFPLTGDEIIKGDYLLLDYSGHDEFIALWQSDTLDEIVDHLISSGGYTNFYVYTMIPIVYGKIKRFKILYKNRIDGRDYFFDKKMKNPPNDDEMLDKRVIWLD